MTNLEVKLFGKTLKTPLIMASGVFGYGDEYDFINTDAISAFSTKGLSLSPKEGNPTPRVVETEVGIINSVGLQNIGVRKFIDEKMPEIKNLPMYIIANFFGSSEDEYIKVASLLDKVEELFALEMNISCPNVKRGGMAFGQDAGIVKKLTANVKKHISKPLIVKLTPNVTDIAGIAKAAEDGGADAVSLINTVRAMAIDIKTGKPILGNVIGGLSGKAIKSIAVRAVYEVAQVVCIPIIGIGGIYAAEDVVEFLMAGAAAVQIGSAVFCKPDICSTIVKDLDSYCGTNKINKLSELTGKALKA